MECPYCLGEEVKEPERVTLVEGWEFTSLWFEIATDLKDQLIGYASIGDRDDPFVTALLVHRYKHVSSGLTIDFHQCPQLRKERINIRGDVSRGREGAEKFIDLIRAAWWQEKHIAAKPGVKPKVGYGKIVDMLQKYPKTLKPPEQHKVARDLGVSERALQTAWKKSSCRTWTEFWEIYRLRATD